MLTCDLHLPSVCLQHGEGMSGSAAALASPLHRQPGLELALLLRCDAPRTLLRHLPGGFLHAGLQAQSYRGGEYEERLGERGQPWGCFVVLLFLWCWLVSYLYKIFQEN